MLYKLNEQEPYIDFSCKTVAMVGVGNGLLADQVAACSPSGLYLIDPWVKREGHIIASGVQDPMQENNFRHVSSRLGIIYGVEISRKYSQDAIPDFEDSSLDCVMLDSDHSVEALTADASGWWNKVAPSGALVGNCMSDGTVRIVMERFCTQNSLTLDELENDMWGIKKS